MLIFVRLITGKSFPVEIDPRVTVQYLKELISQQQGIREDSQRLIFAGQVLKEDKTLSDYNVTKECSIQLFTSAGIISRVHSVEDEKAVEAEHEDKLERNSSDSKFIRRRSSFGGSIMRRKASIVIQDENDDEVGGDSDVPEALKQGDVVIVKLLEARNLVKADFWTGSSDPYVIFVLGANSAKSKTIKRNVNPVWNEIFGFRIKEEDKNANLSLIVFDFDNFTPDDFIGSAEINLSEIKRGELIDFWVTLENVKSGEIHLQVQRCIITSPPLNNILSKLISLERSWERQDLLKYGIQLENITGKSAWINKDASNPALDHLMSLMRHGKIEWSYSSLNRVEKILHTQNMLPTKGLPTRHLWFSGIALNVKPATFLSLMKEIAMVKRVKFFLGTGFALVDFRKLEDALLVLIRLQVKSFQNRKLTIGFGRNVRIENSLFVSSRKAGFLKVNKSPDSSWNSLWLILNDSAILFFQNIQSEEPIFEITLSNCIICSQGLHSLELFDSKNQKSYFIKSEEDQDIEEWKLAIRKGKNKEPFDSNLAVDCRSNDYKCSICKMMFPLDQIFVKDFSEYPACISCLQSNILSRIDNSDPHALTKEFSIQDIQDLLNREQFEKYLEISLAELIKVDKNFVKCPSCNLAVEFVAGNLDDGTDFAKLVGIDKKPLDYEMQEHYLHNRLRCRNISCSTIFCRSCFEIPYHTGFDCNDYKIYKTAPHCRFCDTALMPKVIALNPPSESLKFVCNNEECLKKRDNSCLKMLPCGCPCRGVRGETECAPCLNPEHAPSDVNQFMDDFCNICFTDTLGSGPCVQLECSHVFHYSCVKKRIEEGWSSPQITFGFASCPLCQIKIGHPLLEETIRPIRDLHKEIELKAYERAEYEHILNDDEITQSTGSYYRNPSGFAMNYFAYYMCFKCKNPYFGGQPRCNDGLDRFDPSELICGSCSGVGVEECAKHGKDYIIFKCRFCCSPSTWYCWGTTHFCDDCHRRQEAHDYMTTKTADQLPQCLGPDKCPLRIEHPPNGIEFSLGCGLCRGGSSNQ